VLEKLFGLVSTPVTECARATNPNNPPKDGQSRSNQPVPRKTAGLRMNQQKNP
jgi:hypothetical protein